MNAALIPPPTNQSQAADAVVRAVVAWDECVIITVDAGPVSHAVLNEAARSFASYRVRCIRVSAAVSGGMTSRGLMAQVLGRSDPGALTDGDLKAGFTALTEPGEGFKQVALLVDEAHDLLPPALRYIQLACGSSSKLRVVLAGRPALDQALAAKEFALLRQLFTRRLKLPFPGADDRAEAFLAKPASSPAIASTPLRLVTPQVSNRVRRRVWSGAKLVLAVLLVVWVVRLGSPLVVPETRMHPNSDSRSQAAPARPEAAPIVTFTAPEERPAEPPIPALSLQAIAPPANPEPVAPQPSEAARITDPQPAAESVAPEGQKPPDSLAATALPAPGAAVPLDPLPAETMPPSGLDRTPDATVASMPLQPLSPSPVPESAPSLAELGVLAPEVPASGAEPAVVAGAAVPLLQQSPSASQLAVSRLPEEAAPVRHGREVVERPALLAGPVDDRRCREIVLKVQLGGAPSDAEKLFLRSGCRSR